MNQIIAKQNDLNPNFTLNVQKLFSSDPEDNEISGSQMESLKIDYQNTNEKLSPEKANELSNAKFMETFKTALKERVMDYAQLRRETMNDMPYFE